jgi:hypothetical protein
LSVTATLGRVGVLAFAASVFLNFAVVWSNDPSLCLVGVLLVFSVVFLTGVLVAVTSFLFTGVWVFLGVTSSRFTGV